MQNVLLLISSYVFYGWWDYRFLFLLIFSTALDYFTGIKIHEAKHDQGKKFWLWLSIVVNLGFLGFFKYYNFFIDSFTDLFSSFGLSTNAWTLKLILPVGISFYTFHGMSYIIDIYKGRIEPTKNFIDYSVFVSYFPLLVAGPIERATHLLPQIKKKRSFDYDMAVDGLKQMLWGLFKKIVIADSCAVYANEIFNNSSDYSGSTLLMGAIFFAFQIYGDFSGYSDIALGVSKLFGINLLRNFAYPYFSRDIAEFWRRWHISLSSWFKDYLYYPLGGSKGNKWTTVRNTFIIFIVSGFWHGANWTFIAWGALNAIYFLPLLLLKRNRTNLDIVAQGKIFPSLKELFSISVTFLLIVIAWVFFRANSIEHAFNYLSTIFSSSLFQLPDFSLITKESVFFLIAFFILVEWNGREHQYAIAGIFLKSPKVVKWSLYYTLVFLILHFSGGQKQEFIYFQF